MPNKKIGKLVAWICDECGQWWQGMTVAICPKCQKSTRKMELDAPAPERGFYPNYDEGEGI